MVEETVRQIVSVLCISVYTNEYAEGETVVQALGYPARYRSRDQEQPFELSADMQNSFIGGLPIDFCSDILIT